MWKHSQSTTVGKPYNARLWKRILYSDTFTYNGYYKIAVLDLTAPSLQLQSLQPYNGLDFALLQTICIESLFFFLLIDIITQIATAILMNGREGGGCLPFLGLKNVWDIKTLWNFIFKLFSSAPRGLERWSSTLNHCITACHKREGAVTLVWDYSFCPFTDEAMKAEWLREGWECHGATMVFVLDLVPP